MSLDKLQDRIRKLKNPTVLEFAACSGWVPPHILREEGSFGRAYLRFCRELMTRFQDTVPAVRFRFASFVLLGAEGMSLLTEAMAMARKFGFYVFLDGVESLSRQDAQNAADTLFSNDSLYPFDGLVVSAYIGSDAVKPYIRYLKPTGRDLFVIVRTGNKSASELQDLLTGTRLVHMAAAEIVSRLGQSNIGRSGYSSVGMVSSAAAADSLKALRAKHPQSFLLVEGFDYPNANARNCSFAFDRFGHGAAVCAGESVLAAWKNGDDEGADYLSAAAESAERMKKNLLRYITIL